MDDPEAARTRRGKPAALRFVGPAVAVAAGVALACLVGAPNGTGETPLTPAEKSRQDAFVKRFRRGQELFGGGKDADAETIFRELLAEEPDAAAVHHALAYIHWFRKKPADAIEEFQKAADLAPDDGAIRRDLGLRLADVGRLKDAVPHLEAARKLLEPDVETLCMLGRAYAAVNRHADAERALRAAHQLEPDSVDARTLLARELLPKRAEEALALIAPVPPNWTDVLATKGAALECLGRWTDASACHVRLAEISAPGEAGIPTLRDAAEGLVRCGDAAHAQDVAAKWAERDTREGKTSLRAVVCLAVARCGAGDAEGARKALDRPVAAPQDLPPIVQATLALVGAHVLLETGKTDDAKAGLRAVAASGLPFEAKLARFALGEGTRDELAAASKDDPGRANDIAWAEGVRARLAGDAEGAKAAWKRAAELSKPPGEHPGGLVRSFADPR